MRANIIIHLRLEPTGKLYHAIIICNMTDLLDYSICYAILL